jgi:OOP family OmpA-OmpF porin
MVIFLSMGSNAMAERKAGAFTLTPMIGYHVIDGGMDLDDSASFGLGLGYNISPEWAIETDMRYTPTKSNTGNSEDVDIWTFSLGPQYNFRPDAVLNPYITFGAGLMVYDLNDTSNDEDVFGYYGAGLKYALGESTDLRLDARHLLDYRSDDHGNIHDDADWRHHFQAMVGLTFQFGGTPAHAQQEKAPEPMMVKEEEKAPGDGDRDGVVDPQDKCPDTPPGVRVDSDGCPTDTDGDGVADYLDACADTPKGTAVDARGCPKEPVEVVTLTVNLRFGFDKDQVTPFHYDELKKVAAFIGDYPMYTVVLNGHADDRGPAEYNLGLSQRRADNVRKALIDKYGVAADRISAFGFGESQPVADNVTVEGRKLNRRVEINIHP